MPRATKTELQWAFFITSEEMLSRLSKRIDIPLDEWKILQDKLFDLIISGEANIYGSKKREYLEKTVTKYLYPIDDFLSLTDIAKRFDSDNPSYLIQSWLRSRNTVEFLGEWERFHNPDFDEIAFEKLLADVRSPSYTLTPSKWIKEVNAIGLSSKRGKNGGTMAHPIIACDFEMWNDKTFRYDVLKRFMNSKNDNYDENKA